jgi:hypothetical protein
MRSDDLVPLLADPRNTAVGFRQGVIIAWDPDTAENQVLVGDALMTNLPILNTSEAAILAAGDVVGILTAGRTWGILGRFTIPGTPEAVTGIQSITNRIQATADASGGTRNSTTYGDLTGSGVGPAVTIRIGSSGRALVFWSCELGQTGVLMTDLNPHVGIDVSGASTIAANAENALNYELYAPASGGFQSWIQMGTVHLFTGLNAGDTTFTMKYRHDTVVPNTALTFQAREIAVFAL